MNYAIGNFMGPKVLTRDGRFLKKKYLDRTHQFYERYGGKTIILARFVPIVRTFAPFLAGVGSMSYWQFASYNIVGAVLWISLCLFSGYFFGNIRRGCRRTSKSCCWRSSSSRSCRPCSRRWRVWRHGHGNASPSACRAEQTPETDPAQS